MGIYIFLKHIYRQNLFSPWHTFHIFGHKFPQNSVEEIILSFSPEGCSCSPPQERSRFCVITISDPLQPSQSTVFFELFFLFTSCSFFLPFWESISLSLSLCLSVSLLLSDSQLWPRVGLAPQAHQALGVCLASQIILTLHLGLLANFVYCFRSKTIFFCFCFFQNIEILNSSVILLVLTPELVSLW